MANGKSIFYLFKNNTKATHLCSLYSSLLYLLCHLYTQTVLPTPSCSLCTLTVFCQGGWLSHVLFRFISILRRIPVFAGPVTCHSFWRGLELISHQRLDIVWSAMITAGSFKTYQRNISQWLNTLKSYWYNQYFILYNLEYFYKNFEKLSYGRINLKYKEPLINYTALRVPHLIVISSYFVNILLKLVWHLSLLSWPYRIIPYETYQWLILQFYPFYKMWYASRTWEHESIETIVAFLSLINRTCDF